MRQIFCYILLAISWFAFSQDFENAVNYTVKDGLPSNTVYCVEQDSIGFIWFGTDAGLSRFDGYEFINYGLEDGLPDVEILNFYKDSKNRIWFYTLNGRVGFLKNGKIYNSQNIEFLRGVDFDSRITGIGEIEGKMGISSSSSGFRIFDQKEMLFSEGNTDFLYHIFPYDSDFLLIQRFFEHTKIRSFQATEFEIKEDTIYNEVSSPFRPISYGLLIDDQYVFATTAKNNVKLVFFKPSSPGDITQKQIEDFVIYNVKKYGSEDLLFTSDGIKTLELEKRYDLPHASSIVKDNDQNTWVSTLYNGIYFVSNKATVRHNRDLINSCENLAATEGDLYLSFNDTGIGKFQSESQFTKLFSVDRLVFDLYVNEKSDIWTISPNGLKKNNIKVEGNASQIGSHGRFSNSFVIDRFFLEKGHQYYDTKSKRWGYLDTRSRKRVKDFLHLGEQLYLVSLFDQLLIFDISDDSFRTLNLFDGKSITNMVEGPYGYIWITLTGEGLVRVSKAEILDDEEIAFPSIMSKELFYDRLISVDSTLYASSPSGIDKFEISEQGVSSISRIDQSYGLDLSPVNDLLEFKNRIFVAKGSGLFSFDHSQVFEEPSDFPILIDRIHTSDSLIQSLDNINVPSDFSFIQIVFKAINYRFFESLAYQFKLSKQSEPEGKWVNTDSNTITLSGLSPGEYRFEVRAKTKNSGWTEPQNFDFVVTPLWWQTLWFKALLVLLISTCIYAFVNFQTQVKNKKAILEKKKIISDLKALKAQINPHFLFNSLNSIHSFILEKENELAEDYLVKYSKLMRSILNHSEDLTVPIEEELQAIELYVELEKLRLSNDFDFKIEVDPKIDKFSQKIPSMVIQPLVENAIWHGIQPLEKRGKIEIQITPEESQLFVMIKDNGVGLKDEITKSSKPKGLQLIKERILILNDLIGDKSTFEMRSDSSGTLVQFTFPQEHI